MSGVGRFAVFVDLSTREATDQQVRIRTLQVAEPGFQVEGQPYWGGWSWWMFDCAERTADRLDFASILEGGIEGPVVADPQPAFPASPGGDAAEVLGLACATEAPDTPVFTSVEDAVAEGRRQMLL
ncbi:hypothetical protein J7346_00335 [Brevundimonas sp. A19_0]|nr:hypothetical protein [Brevundimonas sp. A19_0]